MKDLVPYEKQERMAHSLVKSGMFGLQSIDQALALMAIAEAEGKHPAIIARDFHIISGRPSKKAEAMLRDFMQAGGRVEWHALDDEQADATFSHPAGGTIRITWDLERARRAGLAGNDNWRKYARAMLRSRVVSEGIRTVAPIATSGVYTPEEVRDMFAEHPTSEPEREKDVTPPRPRHMVEEQHADFLAAIEAASVLDTLKLAFKSAYNTARAIPDVEAMTAFERAKDRRKRELTAEDAP